MDPEFWRQSWQKNQIGFHQPEPNRLLRKFGDRLKSGDAPRVLVPLCGKSTDLIWLSRHGFQVTGVELVRQAAEAFFRESELAASRTQLEGFERLAGDSIEVLVGDFYELPRLGPSPFAAVYDRAALVAVPPSQRERYLQTLLDLIAPEARLLLVTLSYDASAMNGPPFSVSEAEVRRLFAPHFELECLASEDIIDAEPRFRERGLQRLLEQAWFGVRK